MYRFLFTKDFCFAKRIHINYEKRFLRRYEMKAVTYQGPNQVQVKQVDDAKLEKKMILL